MFAGRVTQCQEIVDRLAAGGLLLFELTRAPGGPDWTIDVALHRAKPFSAAWAGAAGIAPPGPVVRVPSIPAPAWATVRVVAAYR